MITMRILKKLILTAGCLLICSAVLAQAASLNVENSEYSLSVSGSAQSGSVTCVIMPAGEDIDELTYTMMTDNKHIGLSVSSNNQSFSESFKLPQDFLSGEYKILVFDGVNYEERRFVFYNPELDAVSDSIEAAENEQEKKQIIKDNAEKIGISADNAEIFANIVNNIGTLKECYKDAVIILAAKTGRLDDVVNFYAENYGIDKQVYKDLSDKAKTALEEKIKTVDITDLKIDYDKLLKESMFENLSERSELSALLKLLGADMSDYNKLTESKQQSVLNKTLDNLPEKSDELCEVFEKYAKQEYTSKDDNGGGGGGGGAVSGGHNTNSPKPGSVVIEGLPEEIDMVENGDFADTVNHWARDYISKLCKNKVVSGYDDGNFYPDKAITRAEFSTLIVKAMNIAASNKNSGQFRDVNSNDWFSPYVTALSNMGIVKGSDGEFKPNDLIKREDMAVIIYRVIDQKGMGLDGAIEFYDFDSISDYAKEAVTKLAAGGIISGTDGVFNPKSSLTRAEAATVLVKLTEYIY